MVEVARVGTYRGLVGVEAEELVGPWLWNCWVLDRLCEGNCTVVTMVSVFRLAKVSVFMLAKVSTMLGRVEEIIVFNV